MDNGENMKFEVEQVIDEGNVPPSRLKYNREQLLQRMKDFYNKNGRPPTQRDFISNPEYPSIKPYVRNFGNWSNALKAAGLDPNVNIEDKRLLEILKQYFEKYKKVPRQMDFNKNSDYPSFGVYTERFGSWQKALKLVGLDIDTMARSGLLDNNQRKGRMFEVAVKRHFLKESIDLSGENCRSHIDGICPNSQTYDAKSAIMQKSRNRWTYNLNKPDVGYYYLGAFDKEFYDIQHVWRIPGNFAKGGFHIGVGNEYRYNVENMKQYEITDKFKVIMEQLRAEQNQETLDDNDNK